MRPISIRGLLFVYGSLYHFLLFRILVSRFYGASTVSTNTGFVNDPLTNGCVALIGGIFAGTLMYRIVPKSGLRTTVGLAVTLLKAAWLGLAVTFLTFQTLLFLGAIYLTVLAASPGMLVVAVTEVETYAVPELILSVPFGVFSGILVYAFATVGGEHLGRTNTQGSH